MKIPVYVHPEKTMEEIKKLELRAPVWYGLHEQLRKPDPDKAPKSLTPAEYESLEEFKEYYSPEYKSYKTNKKLVWWKDVGDFDRYDEYKEKLIFRPHYEYYQTPIGKPTSYLFVTWRHSHFSIEVEESPLMRTRFSTIDEVNETKKEK